jgi:hypothetical protein
MSFFTTQRPGEHPEEKDKYAENEVFHVISIASLTIKPSQALLKLKKSPIASFS